MSIKDYQILNEVLKSKQPKEDLSTVRNDFIYWRQKYNNASNYKDRHAFFERWKEAGEKLNNLSVKSRNPIY